MLLDVQAFRRRVQFDLDGLVGDLQQETRRASPGEAGAWRNSLPALSDVLVSDDLQSFHVQVGSLGSLALEYRLPASTSWADAVLLGRGETRPSAVIVELKDWRTDGDEPGPTEGLIRHAKREQLHPSDQVRGYAEYSQRFHSVVQDEEADVSGCVFFTFASDVQPYREKPHEILAGHYPIFARSESDVLKRFPAFLKARLRKPDPGFAERFTRGAYRQDRGFMVQVSKALQDEATSPFVLLDEQRTGFEKCMKQVNRSLRPAKSKVRQKPGSKSVVIIKGPPGSGKSAIAAHLWARLAADESIDGAVVMTTTSGSQRSNWETLFERATKTRLARGVIKKANQYNPGLSPRWVKERRDRGQETEIETWRENLRAHRIEVQELRCPDNAYAISIVDEAHALIDPTAAGKRGIPPSGWAMHAGPQAYHILRASKVSVFLLDGDQSYRDNETTTIDSIKRFAKELGATEIEEVDLSGHQFRCAGAAEYVDWIEQTLGLKESNGTNLRWRSSAGGPFRFEVAATPSELEEKLRFENERGHSVRLLASYARPWITKKAASPNGLPREARDFQITYDGADGPSTWSAVWNFAPEQDYTLFVQAPPGSYMAKEPLGEVGCPYVVRGFDFDYIGLLWLEDLVWREDRWVIQLDHVHESAWKKTKSEAKKEKAPGPATAELLQRLQRGYRILLTHAMLGAYVWFADEETRLHVEWLLAH
ncbi:DNA/RNA helicase domain-containing protein [Saltatorellus ferox]